MCRLGEFRRMLAPYLVEDFAAECAACSADTDPRPAPPGSGSDAPAYNMPPRASFDFSTSLEYTLSQSIDTETKHGHRALPVTVTGPSL